MNKTPCSIAWKLKQIAITIFSLIKEEEYSSSLSLKTQPLRNVGVCYIFHDYTPH